MKTDKPGRTIAVYDSGVGGLTVLASLLRKIPTAKYLYVGDTAQAPYGSRSPDEILGLSQQAVERLLAYSPDVVVIACNTVTSTSIAKLREKFAGSVFVGVEPAIKPAMHLTEKKKIVVVATAATIASDAYQALKKTWAAGSEIIDLVKPEWVKMVETGAIDDRVLTSDAKKIVETGADVLVLACTHFPFLKQRLQRLMPAMKIIDSADPVARRVVQLTGFGPCRTRSRPNITWIFSDPIHPSPSRRTSIWTAAQHIR